MGFFGKKTATEAAAAEDMAADTARVSSAGGHVPSVGGSVTSSAKNPFRASGMVYEARHVVCNSSMCAIAKGSTQVSCMDTTSTVCNCKCPLCSACASMPSACIREAVSRYKSFLLFTISKPTEDGFPALPCKQSVAHDPSQHYQAPTNSQLNQAEPPPICLPEHVTF